MDVHKLSIPSRDKNTILHCYSASNAVLKTGMTILDTYEFAAVKMGFATGCQPTFAVVKTDLTILYGLSNYLPVIKMCLGILSPSTGLSVVKLLFQTTIT